jgi:site-specific recombinase XerD
MLLQRTALLEEFTASLGAKSATTIDAYQRAVRQALEWLRERPGHADGFHPDQLTRTAVESYLADLERRAALEDRLVAKPVLPS